MNKKYKQAIDDGGDGNDTTLQQQHGAMPLNNPADEPRLTLLLVDKTQGPQGSYYTVTRERAAVFGRDRARMRRYACGAAHNNALCVIVNDPSVSSVHAIVYFDETRGCFYAEDCGSKNGTLVKREEGGSFRALKPSTGWMVRRAVPLHGNEQLKLSDVLLTVANVTLGSDVLGGTLLTDSVDCRREDGGATLCVVEGLGVSAEPLVLSSQGIYQIGRRVDEVGEVVGAGCPDSELPELQPKMEIVDESNRVSRVHARIRVSRPNDLQRQRAVRCTISPAKDSCRVYVLLRDYVPRGGINAETDLSKLPWSRVETSVRFEPGDYIRCGKRCVIAVKSTARPPSEMLPPRATSTSEDTVELTWCKAISVSAVQCYYVYSSTDGVCWSLIYNGLERECVARDLVPSTTYHFSVQASNSAGPGPRSHPLSVTTQDRECVETSPFTLAAVAEAVSKARPVGLICGEGALLAPYINDNEVCESGRGGGAPDTAHRSCCGLGREFSVSDSDSDSDRGSCASASEESGWDREYRRDRDLREFLGGSPRRVVKRPGPGRHRERTGGRGSTWCDEARTQRQGTSRNDRRRRGTTRRGCSGGQTNREAERQTERQTERQPQQTKFGRERTREPLGLRSPVGSPVFGNDAASPFDVVAFAPPSSSASGKLSMDLVEKLKNKLREAAVQQAQCSPPAAGPPEGTPPQQLRSQLPQHQSPQQQDNCSSTGGACSPCACDSAGFPQVQYPVYAVREQTVEC